VPESSHNSSSTSSYSSQASPGFLQQWVPQWQKGVEHFNARRFWEAHEAWEQGWLKLPPKEKTYIQILIQGAGVFYLVEKGRMRGALSLAAAALQKCESLRAQGGMDKSYPRIEIPGLEELLQDFVQKGAVKTAIFPPENLLQAHLLVSPA
jgi:predicted metal-dependent hydrolase